MIHCSDGIIEEFSTDDEDEDDDHGQNKDHMDGDDVSARVVNPKKLGWIPWVVHYSVFAGKGFFNYCDFYGEKLAWLLGITSPKYYYEIEDFKKSQEEEEEEAKRNQLETVGWTEEGQVSPKQRHQPLKSEPLPP